MSAPTITRINPSSGPITGGTTVIITGTNLATPTAVTFGGTAATVSSSSATSISVTIPAHAAGAARIIVTTGNGATTQPVNFNYVTVAAPVLSSIAPISGPGPGGNLVTITGTNLLYTTGVSFGGTAPSSFVIVSNTQVAAIAPAGTGAISVTVTNGTGTSNPLPYTYTAIAAPIVTSVSPDTGPAAGGTGAVIGGTGFTNATAVTFGSVAATLFTVASDTVINAVVPPGSGAVNVLVTGAGGTSPTGITYTYAAAPTPTVTALTPASGPVSGGNTVTLTGTNLNDATAVTFGGIAASSFTILPSTGLNAVAPPGTAGTAAVIVTAPAGASTAFNYSYIAAPAPTVVFPTAGVIAGGDSVAITGTGLMGTTSVNFGTTPATSFTVVSDTEIDAITHAHPVGIVPINITTPGGTDSSLSFSYQQAPVISSITPTSGPIAGGSVVTISGAGLIGTLDVYFGTTPATGVTISSDNTVTATSPAEAAGASGVTINTASATSNSPPFQYVDAPTLTSVFPTGGPIVGANSVTLTGTGFTTATDVFFGANPAAFSVLNDTTINAVAPSGTGAASVTVENPGGTSGSVTYTYS